MNIIDKLKSEYHTHILPNRTIEAKLFEYAVGTMLLLTMLFTYWLFKDAPDSIPTEYNAAGEATEYTTRWKEVCTNVLLMLIIAFFLIKAYYPKKFDLDTFAERADQLKLASRANRVMGMFLALAMLLGNICDYYQLPDICMHGVVGIIFVGFFGSWLYYIIRIQRC
ncbi:MAG TPA: DUF1648 domain-containing protein [Prevotella sp.]